MATVPIVLGIIQTVAKHNITVQQLKKVFKLLHVQDVHRARYANPIMSMLNELYAAMDVKKPDQSYLLVPPQSGLQIVSEGAAPTLPSGKSVDGILRFPSSGYTLSLWFNLTSLMADWIMEGRRTVWRRLL